MGIDDPQAEGSKRWQRLDEYAASLSPDQYQLMTSIAIVRFWTLVMAAYAFLDEERAHLRDARQAHITLGDARREVQRWHWRRLLDWIHQQFSSGVTPNELFPTLAA